MFRTFLLAASVVSLSGCSFLLVEGPPSASPQPGTRTQASEICTTSMLFPALDAVAGTPSTLFGGLMVAAVVVDNSLFTEGELLAMAAGSLVPGVLWLRSAWNGRKKVNACRGYLEDAVIPLPASRDRVAPPTPIRLSPAKRQYPRARPPLPAAPTATR